MDNETLERLSNKIKQRQALQQIAPGTPAQFSILDIATSGFSTTLELFGADPLPGVEATRRRFPIATTAADFIGISVPYVGWAGAASRIPKLGKVLRAIEKSDFAARAPFRAKAAKEVLRFAPLEAGMLAGTGIQQGPEAALERLPEAAIDLALFGGIGGLAGIWQAGGRLARSEVERIHRVFPEFDAAAPPQLQLRQLRDFVESRKTKLGTEAELDPVIAQATSTGNQLARGIRLQEARKKYLDNLIGVRDQRSVERLFRATGGASAGLKRRRLAASTTDFNTPQDYRDVIARAGLPEGFEQYAQFPRHIEAATTSQEKLVKRALRDFVPVGQGFRLARETDDGLYVVAKRIGEGKPGAKPEWLLFKTDNPERFIPGSARFGKVVEARTALARATKPVAMDPALVEAVPLLKETENFLKQLPFEASLGIPKSRPQEFVDIMMKRLKLDKPGKESAGRVAYVRDFIKSYLAPAQFQFSGSRRAVYLHGVSKFVFDAASAKSDITLYGKISKDVSSIGSLFGLPQKGGIKGLVDKLDEADLSVLRQAWSEGLTPVEAAKLGASSTLVNFLKRMERLDAQYVKEVRAAQEAMGESKLFEPLPQHYMISRTWRGSWRAPIEDEGGNLVWIAGDYTRGGAQKRASEIVKSTEGLRIRQEPFLSDRYADADTAKLLNYESSGFRSARAANVEISKARRPKFFEERHGVRGYVGEDKPFTHKELMQILSSHVHQLDRYMAELITRGRLAEELLKLADENPELYKQLVQRINDRAGKPTPLSQVQNTRLEKLVGPWLGKNPASRIVQVANTLTMNYQLGMANLQFPIINAMTFMQTVLPQMAFVLTAAPERLNRYYTYIPMSGSNGLPRGVLGYLEIPKITAQSFKEIIKPSKVLQADMRRAAVEGVTDPRFVEEYIGEKANLAGQFRAALRGDQGYIQLIKAVSEWLPGQSEKFARGHAFTVGHMLGRDFIKLEGEQLYQFSKEFTEKTMYLYSTADRARIITGPVGSLFGLFKNWTMNYIAQMLMYSGEGFLRGNFAPLLWQTAGTAMLGGTKSLPFYMGANALSETFSDQSLMQNIYDAFGYGEPDFGNVSDAIFMGLPAFLGVSLASTAAAPFSDPARDASLLTSFAQYDRMKNVANTVGAAIDMWSTTGHHPIQSAHVRDLLVRATLPKTFYRYMAVAEGNALRSLNTGNPIIKDLPLYQRVLYSLGMNPQNMEKSFEVSGELWRNQQKRRDATQRFGRAWAEAQQEGDWQELNTLLHRMMATGVDMGSVLRSAAARMSKGREDQIERQFSPLESMPLRRSVFGSSMK